MSRFPKGWIDSGMPSGDGGNGCLGDGGAEGVAPGGGNVARRPVPLKDRSDETALTLG